MNNNVHACRGKSGFGEVWSILHNVNNNECSIIHHSAFGFIIDRPLCVTWAHWARFCVGLAATALASIINGSSIRWYTTLQAKTTFHFPEYALRLIYILLFIFICPFYIEKFHCCWASLLRSQRDCIHTPSSTNIEKNPTIKTNSDPDKKCELNCFLRSYIF